jgi:hypothetical protein
VALRPPLAFNKGVGVTRSGGTVSTLGTNTVAGNGTANDPPSATVTPN